MFGFGEKKFVGVDVGTSAIKIAELKIVSNKPTLTNYAWMRMDGLTGGIEGSGAYLNDVLPTQLKRMIQKANLSGKNAYFSIPAFSGLITLIEFPEMEKEDLDQAIRFEAHKYIPVPLEDIVLSWDVVNKKDPSILSVKNNDPDNPDAGDPERKDEKTQVLLVAAQKKQVSIYEKLAKDSGFKLKAVEIESFPLVRSLIGNDQGNFIIADIGSRVCNIMLVEKGIIKVNRNIDAGGRDVTRVIARAMNIDESRADALKISGKNFLDSESNMSFPVIDLIMKEILRVIKSHFGDESGASSVDGIILSGGMANFPGIQEYFSQKLGIRTISGNPFSRIGYDKKLEPVLESINNQFSVAIGLALGGVNDYLENKK